MLGNLQVEQVASEWQHVGKLAKGTPVTLVERSRAALMELPDAT